MEVYPKGSQSFLQNATKTEPVPSKVVGDIDEMMGSSVLGSPSPDSLPPVSVQFFAPRFEGRRKALSEPAPRTRNQPYTQGKRPPDENHLAKVVSVPTGASDSYLELEVISTGEKVRATTPLVSSVSAIKDAGDVPSVGDQLNVYRSPDNTWVTNKTFGFSSYSEDDIESIISAWILANSEVADVGTTITLPSGKLQLNTTEMRVLNVGSDGTPSYIGTATEDFVNSVTFNSTTDDIDITRKTGITLGSADTTGQTITTTPVTLGTSISIDSSGLHLGRTTINTLGGGDGATASTVALQSAAVGGSISISGKTITLSRGTLNYLGIASTSATDSDATIGTTTQLVHTGVNLDTNSLNFTQHSVEVFATATSTTTDEIAATSC